MKVGLVGWRGMVGSVLMDRMPAERDFDLFDSVFFSTSNAGGPAPKVARGAPTLLDGNDIAALSACDAMITCQGGDYTNAVHPKLRASGWNGYWIDAASALRMKDDAVDHPRPGEPAGDRCRRAAGRQGLHRRQLHGQPDDDGARRPAESRTSSSGSRR